MELTEILYIVDRKEWRMWLESNYSSRKDVWLVYPKKISGKQRILYDDAVEEALCFGWIDSIVKKIDDVTIAQRFSLRKKKSKYSEANKARLRWLNRERILLPEIRDSLKDILEEKYVAPSDIIEEIRSNERAWDNFQTFSLEYISIRLGYIDRARKRGLEFNKRLKYFIKMTEKNKQFGFGGISKYY